MAERVIDIPNGAELRLQFAGPLATGNNIALISFNGEPWDLVNIEDNVQSVPVAGMIGRGVTISIEPYEPFMALAGSCRVLNGRTTLATIPLNTPRSRQPVPWRRSVYNLEVERLMRARLDISYDIAFGRPDEPVTLTAQEIADLNAGVYK